MSNQLDSALVRLRLFTCISIMASLIGFPVGFSYAQETGLLKRTVGTDFPPPASTSIKPMLVTYAEKISLKVPEHPLLTGDYKIADDETVSFPVVGRIPVSNLTPSDLERVVAEELQKRVGRESYVTIEVVDYKPVFVTGYVTRAGATAWKPGFTVMHAEALAGGAFRPTDVSTALPAETEQLKATRAASDLARVLVQIKRLQGERDGQEKVMASKELLELVTAQEADQLVAYQNTMMQSRRNAMDVHMKSLQRSRVLAEQEVNGLKQQMMRIDEQLKLRTDFKETVNMLVKKGYARKEKSFEEQSRIADLEEKRTNVVVALSRISSAVAVLDRDLDAAQQEHIAKLDIELMRAEREAAQLKIDVHASRMAYRKLTGHEVLGANSLNSTGQPILNYEIVRNKNGSPVTMKADWISPVMPGDVVIVRVQQTGTQ
jgi:protein involved in polysaccharide export with SLBB domain